MADHPESRPQTASRTEQYASGREQTALRSEQSALRTEQTTLRTEQTTLRSKQTTSGPDSGFSTLEALTSHYARMLPLSFVRNLIEAEKEIFVVRRDISLKQTYVQFLGRCEGALLRAASATDRAAWEWNYAGPAEAG